MNELTEIIWPSRKLKRGEYVLYSLPFFIFHIALYFLDVSYYDHVFLWLATITLFFQFLWVSMSRLRDLGANVFSVLLFLIPLVNIFLLVYLVSCKSRDQEIAV